MFSARTFSLFALLLSVWLLLSGHWDPFLIGCGVVSSALVVVIAHRMDVIDGEGHPIQLTWRLISYLPWLAWQVAKSNVAVTKTILAPRMTLNAGADWVPATQKTAVGLVAYANSITLTPGTVSLSVYPDKIHVHALDKSGIEELKEGAMDRRVSAMEGPS
ncbi:MAG: cation transporter [Rhodospirillaceae bacterium]|nr:cation transporter [Rhodospirillaceae bacterium]|tara:strand:+ start:3235 stop:3717 length:483 start_codon:yes stop_codon:yes gene_type:complete